jgi:hypothetical protein
MPPVLEELYVLQLISTTLDWEEIGCVVSLSAQQPGETDADSAVTSTLAVGGSSGGSRVSGGSAATSCSLRVRVRIPTWAHRTKAWQGSGSSSASEGVGSQQLRRLSPDPTPGTLLTVIMRAGDSLRLQLWPDTTLRRSVSESPKVETAPSRYLFGVMHGPGTRLPSSLSSSHPLLLVVLVLALRPNASLPHLLPTHVASSLACGPH